MIQVMILLAQSDGIERLTVNYWPGSAISVINRTVFAKDAAETYRVLESSDGQVKGRELEQGARRKVMATRAAEAQIN